MNERYMFWKGVISRNVWYHFCVVWVQAWMNRRHRLRESTCAKVLKWENELNVSNEMDCICFLQKQSHTHTRAQSFFNIWYSICVAWLILGMLLSPAKTELIPKSQLFYSNMYYMYYFGASRFLHSLKQCLLFIQAWTHTTHKWYQMIRD